jgi:peroxiredoxin
MTIQILIPLLIIISLASGQTTIQIIIKNAGQHKIDKVDAFDLSQKEQYDYRYKDTLVFHFRKTNIDCYNIRYHENRKMFREQIWLDTGNIKIEAHIDSSNLIIDTVINSPAYYKVRYFAKRYSEFSRSNDTNAMNSYLLNTYKENIDNPFSLLVGDNYIRLNQNSKPNLITFKKLTEKQGGKFSWFLLYPSVTERLNKILSVDKINFNEFSFINTEKKKGKILLKGADYYILDFWFLACPPCVRQHKDINANLEKLKQKNIEMIGISIDQNFKKWKNYLAKNRYNWQNYLEDKGNAITKQLSIKGFPAYIIVNSSGEIINTYNSFADILKKFGLD